MADVPLIDPDLIATINSMTGDRGWILNSYAQVEFLLADLAKKASELPGNEAWADRPLAFGMDSRIRRIEQMTLAGPLADHAEVLGAIIAEMRPMEEARHFYTHGFAIFAFTPRGDRAIQFRRYVPPARGGVASLESIWRRPADLALERERATDFAQRAVGVFREIYRRLGLDPDADVQPMA